MAPLHSKMPTHPPKLPLSDQPADWKFARASIARHLAPKRTPSQVPNALVILDLSENLQCDFWLHHPHITFADFSGTMDMDHRLIDFWFAGFIWHAISGTTIGSL